MLLLHVIILMTLKWVAFPILRNGYLHSLSWQVNIDYRTREKTKQSLEDPSPTSLNEVQAKVYGLMEKDSYPRFLRSKMYQDIVSRTHAQGQRRSVWLNLMTTTMDIKLDLKYHLYCNNLKVLWQLWPSHPPKGQIDVSCSNMNIHGIPKLKTIIHIATN